MNIEKYLSNFDKFTKDPNLDAMKFLMEEFNNPHEKLKFIHVAGTNGKGSVCEMLSNILVKTEYKIGKFISPHLVKFNDGIYINNKQINNNEVQDILIPLSKAIDKYNQTHEVNVKWFEAITALTLIYFAKNNCDLVVLETGLGGTVDCTNIVSSIISVITNIGYDHMDVLGDTIEKITIHKAGIIKPNSDTVACYQKGITEIIEKVSKQKKSKLHIISDKDISNYSYDFNFQKFDYKKYKNVYINLKGKKQIYNASQVLECIEILKDKGYEIPNSAIFEGLKTVVHHARLEVLKKSPLVIFDGGHNENAIKNLKENINQYFNKNKSKVYIISLLKTKDYKTITKLLIEKEDAIFYFTDGNDKQKYVSKEDLYKEAIKYSKNKEKILKKDLKDSIKEALEKYKDSTILIVGSFYVYKDVIKLI